MRPAKDLLLSFWWISWFGIIGAFFMVGIWEYRYLSHGGVASKFSLTLFIIISILWAVFYAVEEKARGRVDGEKNRRVVVELLTMAGTFLAVFTLLGISFFIYIAPHIH